MLNNRQEIIDAFKTGNFPCMDGFQIKEESEEKSEEESEEKIKDEFKNLSNILRMNQRA